MSERNIHSTPPGEGFVGRWSRRKLARKGEAEPPMAQATTAPAASPEPNSRPLLPAIETLDEASDYSAFLGPEVSEELQRLALRKLFGTTGFNIRDGLDDYADDYRCFDELGDVMTADLRHRLERELREEAAAARSGQPEPVPASPGDATATDDVAADGDEIPPGHDG